MRPGNLTFCCLCAVFQFPALSSPQSPFPATPASRRALHRTLSDESIYSGQREHFFTSRASLLDQALPNDVLFSSTYPSLPKSLPLRRPSYTLGMKSLHGKLVRGFSRVALLVMTVSPETTVIHFAQGMTTGGSAADTLLLLSLPAPPPGLSAAIPDHRVQTVSVTRP